MKYLQQFSQFISILLLFACNLHAQDTDYYQLKSEYLSLKNSDPRISKEKEWVNLAKRLERFYFEHGSNKDSVEALYNAVIAYEEIYKATSDKTMLNTAITLLTRLYRDHPHHELADDALIRLGNAYLYGYGSKTLAERAYSKVIDEYPDSDMYPVALAKLKQHGERKERQTEVKAKLKYGNLHQVPVVVIDPGHGGEDTGARGKYGLLEKDVVLDIALKIKKMAEKQNNFSVKLTRTSDVFVPLVERANIANDFEASIFLSLHVNSLTKGKTTGIETYYLDNTKDKASQRLAAIENQAGLFLQKTPDLNFILSDLIQRAKLPDSILLAKTIHTTLVKGMAQKWGGQKDLGIKKAPFYLLVGAHMPCILLELYFINNPKDEERLSQENFRMDIAKEIVKGIEKYFLKVTYEKH
ncbi:MAG: hypothetical protein D6808_06550 [Candidatus Dadabacteria bacterium]|nr:MAG: hypothetical protein D6808_06550 [Candidatus Dadabacteria bacterium]